MTLLLLGGKTDFGSPNQKTEVAWKASGTHWKSGGKESTAETPGKKTVGHGLVTYREHRKQAFAWDEAEPSTPGQWSRMVNCVAQKQGVPCPLVAPFVPYRHWVSTSHLAFALGKKCSCWMHTHESFLPPAHGSLTASVVLLMFCQKVGSSMCFKSNMSYTAALKICLSSAYCYSISLAQANPQLLFDLRASEGSSGLCYHPLWRGFPFINYCSWISPGIWLWGRRRRPLAGVTHSFHLCAIKRQVHPDEF